MSELKARMLGQTMNEYGCDTKIYLKSEADKVIAELEDKCQMHDFFWAGCGFAKRGFKNTIAVSEAFDKLEAENVALKKKNDDYRYTIAVLRKEKIHQKYKRCLAMAEMCCEKKDNCYNRALRKYTKDEADYLVRKSEFWQDWEFRWLKLAEKFKEAK